MPKVSTIQSNFNGGEISPLVYGRVDAPRYKESLAICKNYLPLIQGPITRRPGTAFVFPVKDSSAVTRLIPFEFSTTQAYMLEFGNSYIRFYKNNGIVTNTAKAITAITQASPGVVTSVGHGFSNNDHVVLNAISGMTELDNREFKVANKTADTFTLVDNITGVAENTTSYVGYTSGGTAAKIYEVNMVGKPITGATNANPIVITCPSHALPQGQIIYFSGVGGMTQLNGPQYIVNVVDSNTFQLHTYASTADVAVDSTAYGVYTSGGFVDVASNGMYATADLPNIQYVQSNDVLYMVHPSYPPRKLVRVSDTNWQLSSIAFIDGPYGPVNSTTTTLTTSAGDLIVTASSVAGINDGQGFLSTDVGRAIRIKWGSAWAYGEISVVTDTTHIVISPVAPVVGDHNPHVNWRLGVWSNTDGFPSSIVFHEDRLVFSGAGFDPTRFDGSTTSDYENMAPSDLAGVIAADNAYAFSLSSNDGNAIQWMTSDEQGLVMGTQSGEWKVGAADATSALSAISVSAKKTTSMGSDPVQAVQSGKCTLFVQRGGRKLRELNYYFDVNGFRAADLTQLSEHITGNPNGDTNLSGISFLAVQKNPQPVVWATRYDGVLLAMTYERDLDTLKVGWSRHIIGGVVTGGGDAQVESVAVIPSSDGTSEDAWIIVNREINGVTVRYVEYITQLFDDNTPLKDAIFVDSALTYSGSAVTTVGGLNHLNGQMVSVLADGIPLSDRGVTSGRITLDSPASLVTIGLKYNSDGQKLRSDAGSADGTGMGKTRRIHRVGIQFLNTLGFMLGPDFTTLDDITLDDTSDSNFDQALGLYTGIASEHIPNDYDYDNMFCWRQNQPLPGTILGIYPIMVTQDR